MSERGPSNIERAFTVGGVEKSVEQRIYAVAQKVKEAGVLDSSRFETDEDRKLAADDVIKSINPSFSSYEQVVNISRGETYSETQKKNARETFDVLRRSISLAMNDGSNQELQTRLFTGGLEEVLPKSFLYGKDNSSLNLVDGVREVTITSSVIRESLRELESDRVYKRAKGEFKQDRELKAGLIEGTALKLIELDLPDDNEDELFAVRAYLNTQAGILRGELGGNDGSVDKADQVAVLGKVTEVMEKMTEVAEKISSATSRTEISKPDRSSSERKTNSRSGVELIKHPSLPDTEEEQLEYIEERLKIIENYKTGNVKSEISLNELTYSLFTLLTTEGNGLVSKRLLDIINARLTLKDVSSGMRANNGSMGEGGRELVGTISKLGQQGYDMSPDVMKAFFGNFGDNELKPGEEKLKTNLKTAEAWDLMEEANFDYQKFVNLIFSDGGKRSEKLNKMIADSRLTLSELRVCKELLATKGTLLEGQVFNYYFEAEGGKLRAAMVRQYMVDNLMDRFDISEERAERSIRLAEEMYFASMENCVVDWDFLNGDQYAEMVHLQFIRKLDGQMNKKGKITGPSASLNHIKTLTPGWIRSFCGVKNPAVKITSSEIMAALNAGSLTGKEQWAPHLVSVICGKVWAAKQLITSEVTPLTKDVLKTSYWKGVNDYFNKVDGQIGINGSMDGVTKTAWVAGIFQLILTNRDSEWKPDDIRLLRRILTKDIITNQESGDGRPFLTDKQWKWIEETLKVRSNTMRIGFFGGLDRLFGGKR